MQSDKPYRNDGGGPGDTHYPFTSPYPKPSYDYPTSHKRTKSDSNLSHGHDIERVPSPTPSELEEMNQPFISRRYFQLEFYKRPKTILVMIAITFFGILTILMTVYHKQIENWFQPTAIKIHNLKFGWLIPIAILFIISFPPLFGHEIIAVLCGNVWGLWVGFAIVSAGTLLGEIGNFYAFKYICQSRSNKAEKNSWIYACLAKTVREGGFKIAVMARLSVLPGHFTTAIFATCGMNIFLFIIAAILSMPKQFITVYLGVLLEQSDDPAATPDKKSRIVSDIVLVASGLLTVFAGWYIYHEMCKRKLSVVRDRRAKASLDKAPGYVRQGGMVTSTVNDSATSLVSNDVFNPGASTSELYHPQPLATHPFATAEAGVGGYRQSFGQGNYGFAPPSQNPTRQQGRQGAYDHSRASGQFEPQAPIPQQWDSRGRAIDYPNPHSNPTNPNIGYDDDPYAYNSYPPTASTGAQQASAPPPTTIHTQAPSSVDSHQPQSPFGDEHAVPDMEMATPKAPRNAPRYALEDPGSGMGQSRGHEQEQTDATYHSARSDFGSE